MRPAHARVLTRLALALALAGCGDGTLDPADVDITGAWTTTVENITGPTGAEPVLCTASWVMTIEAADAAPQGSAYTTQVPLDASFECTDGYSAVFGFRGVELAVGRTGSDLVFLRRNAGDTFVVARVDPDGRLRGTLAEKFYGGGDLVARR